MGFSFQWTNLWNSKCHQEMERQSAQGQTSASDADQLKEELRRLQKQRPCCTGVFEHVAVTLKNISINVSNSM